MYIYIYHFFCKNTNYTSSHSKSPNIMVNLRYPACLFQADWKLFTSIQHTLCIKPTS